MPDIAIISSILGSVKTATEITKLLRETDFTIEKAELKLKLADLVVALADTKMQLADIQELINEKDKKISELENAFETRAQFIRPEHHDAYYKVLENGKPIGVPHCLGCWENHHKVRQLVRSIKIHGRLICTSCGQEYLLRSAPYIKE